MELLLNEEQTLVRDSAATFTERQAGAERLRGMRISETKVDVDVWRRIADAGWLGILASEAEGGLGLGLTELCLVAEELGKGLIPEPVATVAAVAKAMESDCRHVISGSVLVMPALMEGARTIGDETPTVIAVRTGDIIALSGIKTGVPIPGDARQFLLSATAPEGVILALVDADDVEITQKATTDGTSIGSVILNQSAASLVVEPKEAPARIAHLLDALHLSNAAELLGVMEKAQIITVEYLKNREQFDRPIGSFQVLQHRAVDNLCAIEMCRSLIYQAARAMDEVGGEPGLASAALSRSAKSSLEVCKSALQMHGGIGFTDEHDIGLCLKRAVTLVARYGNAGLHRKRYAKQTKAQE